MEFSNENSVIVGRNAVMEAVKADVTIDTLYVMQGEKAGIVGKIIALCKKNGAVIKEVNSLKLQSLSGTSAHQGVVAVAACKEYSTVEDILQNAQQKGQAPFIIIADEIEDPHNLGAIIRSAEAAGAHGLIIPKRRQASLTPIVYKTSAGAVNHLPVARVSNLASTIDQLKAQGVWIYGLDMDGKSWCETDFSGGCAIVIGSEGNGIGRLIKEKCDFIVSLPMLGKTNSLNASVAGAIVMYEVTKQRLNKK